MVVGGGELARGAEDAREVAEVHGEADATFVVLAGLLHLDRPGEILRRGVVVADGAVERADGAVAGRDVGVVLVDELVRAERLLVLAQRLLEPACARQAIALARENLAVRHRATVRVSVGSRVGRAHPSRRRKRPNSHVMGGARRTRRAGTYRAGDALAV